MIIGLELWHWFEKLNHTLFDVRFALTLLAGFALVPSSHAEDLHLSPFTAVYHVHHSGARVGEMTMELEKLSDENSTYRISSYTEPRGLATFFQKSPIIETSTFHWNSNGEQVGDSYSFIDGSKKGKRNSEIEFDWDNKVANSVYKGQNVEIEIEPPLADRLALKARITNDLRLDKLQDHYRFIDRNEIKTYQFEMLGKEVLDTPAGRYNTVKVRQFNQGSSRSITLWLAQEYDFATVKLMQFKDNKPRTVLSIKKLVVQELPDESSAADNDNDNNNNNNETTESMDEDPSTVSDKTVDEAEASDDEPTDTTTPESESESSSDDTTP